MLNQNKIDNLILFLSEAEQITANFSGKYLHYYLTPKEFEKEIQNYIINLKNNNSNILNNIYNSFHLDSEWHDLTGKQGKEIGTSIFNLTLNLILTFENKKILELIHDFIETAEQGVSAFKAKFGVTDLLDAWHIGKYTQTGKLEEFGIMFYAFHGCGLSIHFKNKSINFDFTYLPEIRHDGFDLWRLHGFAQAQPTKYHKYFDKSILEKEFNLLLNSGIICLPKSTNSPQQYFLTSSLNENQSS